MRGRGVDASPEMLLRGMRGGGVEDEGQQEWGVRSEENLIWGACRGKKAKAEVLVGWSRT